MDKVFRKKKFIITRAIIFVLILALVAAATGAVVYWNTAITMYFEGAGSDYTSLEATEAHAFAVDASDRIESEGIVLLKNESNALPLKKNAKITVLGYDAINFYYGGAGSGAGGGEKNPTTFREAMEHAGFSVNAEILDMYANSGIKRGTISMGGSDFSIGEIPQSKYTPELINNAKANYGDAAIIVIGRSGAEGGDVATNMSSYEKGNNGHYLELNQDEKDMLAMANENFDSVIVVINSPSAMELGWITDGSYSNLKAAIWVGQPGPYGMDAIGKVLCGDVNPSGHLVDTYAVDLTENPTFANFGNYEYSDASGYYFVNYNEGIYVGYRYYETRYEDAVMGTENVGNFQYNNEVVFPFGFGLSYTRFEWSGFSVKENGADYDVSLTVKNTGSAAGKDVVQVYLQKPYTDYDRETGMEKAAVDLVGFVKTEELAPGKSQKVTVSVAKEQLKSYDEWGYGTYILEAGDYYLTAAGNAHQATNNVLGKKGYTIANGMTEAGNDAFVYAIQVKQTDSMTYAVDQKTGTAVSNQFASAERNLEYLSRKDWEGTFPTAEKVDYRAGDRKANFDYQVTDEGVEILEVNWEQDNGLTLYDMAGKDYDDPDWDRLIEQMTKKEMKAFVGGAGWKTNQVNSISKPKSLDLDGPAGYSEFYNSEGLGGAQYPIEVVVASTWNVEMAKLLGECVGLEGTAYGITGWYGPAMNIHRSPYAGRNFEYYSEDGFISGKMGANTVAGAWKHGVYGYIKHFALNDQETNRSAKGLMTWSNEQAIREIYLVPFELSVKEGGAVAVMSSFNRIGDVWSGGHKGLLTNVLRGEWGFVGFVLTDAVQSTHMLTSQGLRAGNDAWLSVASTEITTKDDHSAATWSCIKTAIHNMLYVITNSNIWIVNGIEDASATVTTEAATSHLWVILFAVGAALVVFADLLFGIKSIFTYKKRAGVTK